MLPPPQFLDSDLKPSALWSRIPSNPSHMQAGARHPNRLTHAGFGSGCSLDSLQRSQLKTQAGEK